MKPKKGKRASASGIILELLDMVGPFCHNAARASKAETMQRTPRGGGVRTQDEEMQTQVAQDAT